MNWSLTTKLASASFFVLATLSLNSCEALGFVRGKAEVRNVQLAETRLICANLVQASQGFFDDYNHLPIEGEKDTVTSNAELVDVLMGLNADRNPKGVLYFQGAQAKEGRGGLVKLGDGPSSRLVDPWGNEFFLRYDTDHNGNIPHPFEPGKILFGRRVITWSAGPDGKTNPDPKHAVNKDNIYSWE